jgi:hypothetical protein
VALAPPARAPGRGRRAARVVWRWGEGREGALAEGVKQREETPDSDKDRERGSGGAPPPRARAPTQRHCEKQEEGEGGETTREGARGGSATTWLWRNEAQERWARAKREGFFIIGTRPVNRKKQIKQTHLHATGLTDDFWPISNTPRDRVDTANDKLFLPLPSATGLTNKTNAISPNLAHSERSNAPPRKPLE